MYRIEDQASAVKELQRLLGLNQTAFYDKKTREAVLMIQKELGLEQTGITDYATFNAIVNKYRNSMSQIWNSNYLFKPIFPYRQGDMNDNVEKINDALKIVLKNFTYEGVIPGGKYYGKDTQDAVIFLRSIFKMIESEEIDEAFMNRLIFEKAAIEIKSLY